MCTSSSERKTVTWSHAPDGASATRAGPAYMTLPSAGARTRSGADGTVRSGSRKNNATATGNTNRITVTGGGATAAAIAAGNAASRTNGSAAGSTLMTERASAAAGHAPAAVHALPSVYV